MRVDYITKIKGYRIFRDFAWPRNLLPFAQYNLIYGWNGSGKTALASLFAYLQDHSAITEGEVEFEIDEKRVSGADLAFAHIPDVRVFDRDSITNTILLPGKQAEPIYYIGEESVEKQKQILALKDELKKAEEEVEGARSNKASAETSLEEFCTRKGSEIKEAMEVSEYVNYDKRLFKRTAEGFHDAAEATAFLSTQNEKKLRRQKGDQPKSKIDQVEVTIPDFDSLLHATVTLLEHSVISTVIEELRGNIELAKWIKEGLSLHTGDGDTSECKFCGGVLAASRLRKLRAHFNDDFTNFQSDVQTLMDQIREQRDLFGGLGSELPEPTRFYSHLEDEIISTESDLHRRIKEAEDFFGSLLDALRKKLDSAFESTPFDNDLNGTKPPDTTAFESAVNSVNTVIGRHNATTDGFQKEFKKTCENLEKCLVARAYPEYRRLKDDADIAAEAFMRLEGKPDELRGQTAAIEREIIGHRKPAEELNGDLRSYLGRDELRFEWKDPGYEITRDGSPARDLSESEKTAIAFLYFLKRLKDRSFDIENGVVVVDDPVSSLDANSLFSAFGYMKERTKKAGQLFILTHNFVLFRQVRRWFLDVNRRQKENAEKRGPKITTKQFRARFYLLEACGQNGQRSAKLKRLDPLLEKFESEYHYLFKIVYAEAERADTEAKLEHYYAMPNVARRLLETFLAFKYPHLRPERLGHLLDHIEYEPEKKSRILRFLHTYSHSEGIEEPEHDLSALSETKSVLIDVLDLIRSVDNEHYEAMKHLIVEYGDA